MSDFELVQLVQLTNFFILVLALEYHEYDALKNFSIRSLCPDLWIFLLFDIFSLTLLFFVALWSIGESDQYNGLYTQLIMRLQGFA